MRGGFPDPFDPDGSGETEPGGLAVIVWSGVAAVALLFAVVAMVYSLPEARTAGVDPERFGRAGDLPREVEVLAPRADFSMQAVDDAGGAADVSGLRVENAALRQSVAGLERRLADMSARIGELEDRLESVTGSIDARPVARPAPPPGVGGPAVPAATVTETLGAEPAPVRRTPFGVELGTFRDLGSLRAAWADLTRAQPGLLDDLSPVATVRDTGAGTDLLLVAGPFASAADAAARCELARAAGVDCLPAFYVGQPLATR